MNARSGRVPDPVLNPQRTERKPAIPKAASPTGNVSGLNPQVLSLMPYITGKLRVGDSVGTMLYDEIAVINGATTGYAHKLGRIPNGFLILNTSANLNFWVTDVDLAAFTALTSQWHANAVGKVRGFWW